MKLLPTLSAALLLSGTPCRLHAQEALSDADKALFDDLQVSEEAEKAARLRLEKTEKPPAPPPPEMPATAAKLLDRLTVYEASLHGIADEIITRSRKTLSGEMIKLSSAAAEPAKTELITAAKEIEGLPPGVELPAPAVANDFPGEWKFGGDSRWYIRDGKVRTRDFTGAWRWVNQSSRVVIADYIGSEYVDVMRLVAKPGKPLFIEGINQKADHWTLTRGAPDPVKTALPAEANKLLAAARGNESQAQSNTLRQARERRERVAAWLVEHAKTAPPAAAKILLENAGKLRSPAAGAARGNALRRNPDTFRGKIYSDQKRRTWEFLPNGSVKGNGLAWGAWEWAKSGDDSCLIISSGGGAKTEIVMLVRISSSTPGKLYFIGFEDKFEASLKP